MKKLIWCLCAFLGTFSLTAQSNSPFSVNQMTSTSGASGLLMSQAMSNKLRVVDKGNKGPSKDYIGSPYLSDNFTRTTLYYDGVKENTVLYRFNAYNQEIELKNSIDSEATIYAVNKDKKIGINVLNSLMSFKTFITSKKKTINGYLINIFDGEEYDLYKRIIMKYSPGRPSPNSFVPDVPARFSEFTEYYFQKKDVNRIDEILLSNKKLLKLLDGETKNKVKIYLKDNNLNVKNEIDLIKVFEFLNKK